jgi:hypothetical protein
VTITPSISAGETNATVTINGEEYTGMSSGSTATASSRQFVGSTANVSTTITNLAAAINDSTYNVEGVYASAGSTTLTLRFAEQGEKPSADYDGIWVTSSSTTDLTVAGVCMQGIIEVPSKALSLTSSFTHAALNIINTAAYYVSATVIRGGNARYSAPTQVEPFTKQG